MKYILFFFIFSIFFSCSYAFLERDLISAHQSITRDVLTNEEGEECISCGRGQPVCCFGNDICCKNSSDIAIGCAPADGICCAAGHACAANQACCGNGCMDATDGDVCCDNVRCPEGTSCIITEEGEPNTCDSANLLISSVSLLTLFLISILL